MIKHLIFSILFIGLSWGQTLGEQYLKAKLLHDSDLNKEAKILLNDIIISDEESKVVNQSLLLLGEILVSEIKPRKAKKIFDRLILRDDSYTQYINQLLSIFAADGIYTRYGYNVHPNPLQASFICEAVVSVSDGGLSKAYGFQLINKVWSHNIGGVDYYDRKDIYLTEAELLSFHDELKRFVISINEENKKKGNSSITKSIEFPSGLSFSWISTKNKSKDLKPQTNLYISKNGKNISMTNIGELSMVIKNGIQKISELKLNND